MLSAAVVIPAFVLKWWESSEPITILQYIQESKLNQKKSITTKSFFFFLSDRHLIREDSKVWMAEQKDSQGSFNNLKKKNVHCNYQ